MKKIFTIFMLIVFASCTRTVYVPTHSKQVIIDTVTQVVSDSSMFRALLECDSMGQVVMKELITTKGRMANQDITVSGGEVRVITRWQTKYVDRIKEIRDTTTVVEIREVVKTVKHIPKVFIYAFVIAVIAIGTGAWKIVEKYKRG